jgi:hypothetical protein
MAMHAWRLGREGEGVLEGRSREQVAGRAQKNRLVGETARGSLIASTIAVEIGSRKYLLVGVVKGNLRKA